MERGGQEGRGAGRRENGEGNTQWKRKGRMRELGRKAPTTGHGWGTPSFGLCPATHKLCPSAGLSFPICEMVGKRSHSAPGAAGGREEGGVSGVSGAQVPHLFPTSSTLSSGFPDSQQGRGKGSQGWGPPRALPGLCGALSPEGADTLLGNLSRTQLQC